jgi:tetratricopeptide (TPR) repeat protein
VNPNDYQAPSLLGFTYRCLDMDEQAKVAYTRSLDNIEHHLELNPGDARAYYLGSIALADRGEKEKAVSWVEKAIELEPDDPYNLYGCACFYGRINEVDKSLDLLEKSIHGGFAHKEWIDNDGDLDPLRDHTRFKELMSGMK